jgi:CelD/BcsL family acetyltransferase involved in cellulose biosynthesis
MQMAPSVIPDAAAPEAGAGIRPERVAVFEDVGRAQRYWQEIERSGGIRSPYQHYDWVRLWHDHVSGPAGLKPCIVVGFDAAGGALFVWPLVRGRFGPLTTASFFGGKHATLNVALWRPDAARGFSAEDMNTVLRALARECPDIDLVMLANQPATWHGLPNPFALLPHQTSTEDNFVLRLDAPGPDVIARQVSANARSRLRYHERKLATLKGYRYVRPDDPADVERLLAAFFDQKAAKFAALGLDDPFAPADIRNFVRATCLCGLAQGAPLMELHALESESEMLALFSGLHDGKRYTCAFTSHTIGEAARFSPGVTLLHRLILGCAERGLGSFDVGPGAARYKSIFCKDFEPLFDSILPLSTRGRIMASLLRMSVRLKSGIKRNATLWRAASAVRSAVNRAKGGKSANPQD